MAKDQVNIRVSTTTREKLDFLTERHGTQTEAMAVAIDRLYQEEQMSHKQNEMSENILMSGDLHQAQEEVWHGNVNNTVDEFLDGLSIEQAVDEFIAAYPEHWEPMPIYELKMTGSTYTLREMLIGYLERMTG